MALMAMSANILGSDGWTWRLPESQISLQQGYGNCRKTSICPIGAAGEPQLILAGDSHAKHLVHGVDAWGKLRGIAVLAMTSPSCNLTFDMTGASGRQGSRCASLQAEFEQTLAKYPDVPVLLSELWRGYATVDITEAALADFLGKHAGRTIIVVGQAPQPDRKRYLCGYVPSIVMGEKHCINFNPDRSAEMITERWKTLISKFPNAELAELTSAICNGETCAVSDKGDNLFADSHHFSASGSLFIASRSLAPLLDPHFKVNIGH
jgi:hypothetical protein